MKLTLVISFLLVCLSYSLYGQVQVGDKSPQFEALDDSNNLWKSSQFMGDKIMVVYFYPAAMTGGCTKQACAFRDDKAELDGLDVLVVGISGDNPENLKYFKEAHDLNFPLLADTDGMIAKKFGVPLRDGGSIVRNIEGVDLTLQRGVTSSRWTFVISKTGDIVYKNTEVNAAEDSKNTLKVIKNL